MFAQPAPEKSSFTSKIARLFGRTERPAEKIPERQSQAIVPQPPSQPKSRAKSRGEEPE